MTAYTSSQAGNWNTAATWGGGGFPIAGDTCEIRHAVDMTVAGSVGTSPGDSTTFDCVINGAFAAARLTIKAGITFTPKTNVKIAGDGFLVNRFIREAGSVVEFDVPGGVTYVCQYGSGVGEKAAGQSTGTFANPAYFRSKSGGGKVALTRVTGSGDQNDTYTEYRDVENASHEMWASTPSQCITTATGCQYVNCGTWMADSGVEDGTIPTNRRFTSCSWSGTTGTRPLNALWTGGATGDKYVQGCVFDKTPLFSGMEGMSATLSGNVFLQRYTATGSTTKSPNIQANFIRQIDENGIIATGDVVGNYFLTDVDIFNPHWIELCSTDSSKDSTDNVFDHNGSFQSGDCHSTGTGTAGTRTYNIKRNISLPSTLNGTSECGTMLTLLGNDKISFVVEHNTCFQSHQGSVSIGETYAGYVDIVTSCKSNITWCDQGVGDGTFKAWGQGYGMTNNALSAANADYNGGYNVTAGTKGNGYDITCDGSPGAHDVTGNPGFVDPRRNIKKWDQSLGGANTVANAVAELAKKNDFTGYNSAYSISALLTYVKAGFAPTSVLYHNTAHDGTDIGAVAWQASSSGGVLQMSTLQRIGDD